MFYAPPDTYLWDFWLVRHNDTYHIYHLQAPRCLVHPEMRHDVATVRHAISKDLVHWTDRGLALGPGPDGGWDDKTIWTGSVVEKDGTFYMFYTGRSRVENGTTQRIGLAISEDLKYWERYGDQPLIEADSRWYERLDGSARNSEFWRDPFIFFDEENRYYYAFITARVNHGDPQGRGCIAAARSRDLLEWEVLPPVSAPGHFYEMEVPNVWKRNDRYYLTFSTDPKCYTEAHAREIAPKKPQRGIFYYVSHSLLGPYVPIGDEVLLGSDARCYTSQVIQGPEGDDVLLTWREQAPTYKGFAGCLDLPRRVIYRPDGGLALSAPTTHPATA